MEGPQRGHGDEEKTIKKENHRSRRELISIPLTDRLREDMALGLPALGLQFINEWINPRHHEAPRRYTCTLEGCKSAWGDSEDMYRHLVGKTMTHNKNYLIYHLGQKKVTDGLILIVCTEPSCLIGSFNKSIHFTVLIL